MIAQGEISSLPTSASGARDLIVARKRGWLVLSPSIGERTLQRWQRECERKGRPFAVVRLEPQRATLWFILAAEQEWSDAQQREVRAALSEATGCVVQPNSACAFAKLGTERALMERLLTAALRGAETQSSETPIN